LSEEPSNLGPFWKKKQQLEMNMLQTWASLSQLYMYLLCTGITAIKIQAW
jgi:hypothetical protein